MIDFAALIAADPLVYGTRAFGIRRWSAQREMCRAIRESSRVQFISGNGTGKTHNAGRLIVETVATNPYSRTIVTGPSSDSAKHGLWQEVQQAYHEAAKRVPMPGVMLDSEWKIAPGWDAAVVNPDSPSGYQGRRGQGDVYAWIDEAQGFDQIANWIALDSICQTPGSFIVAMGNPLWPQGPFYANTSPSSGWRNVWMSAWRHPNIGRRPREFSREWVDADPRFFQGISRKWIADKYAEWCPGGDESDHNWIARVLGIFPEAGMRQLIARKLLEACAKTTPRVAEEPRGGLDCARNPGGGDRNAIAIFNQNRRCVFAEAFFSDDLIKTADRFYDRCKEFGVPGHRANIDQTGLGAGAVDYLRARRAFPCNGVSFGASANGGWRKALGNEALHANQKAELFDALRYCFRNNLISIPDEPQFRGIWADLPELQYDAPEGRMKIEDKDKTRKRIGRSPDFADAVAVAMYQGAFVAPTEAQHREMARRLGV